MGATRTPLTRRHTAPIVAPPPPITPGPTIIPGPGEPQPELEPSILASLLSGGARGRSPAKATDPTNSPTAATSPTPNHQRRIRLTAAVRGQPPAPRVARRTSAHRS